MYPKSIEWIEKVLKWLSTSSEKDIISKFGLNKDGANTDTIGEVFIFVIVRNHVHFTGQELDERAAWASWYQLVHSFSRVKTTFDDPIRKLYMKLKFGSPNLRAEREGYRQLHPFEIELEDYKLSFWDN